MGYLDSFKKSSNSWAQKMESTTVRRGGGFGGRGGGFGGGRGAFIKVPEQKMDLASRLQRDKDKMRNKRLGLQSAAEKKEREFQQQRNARSNRVRAPMVQTAVAQAVNQHTAASLAKMNKKKLKKAADLRERAA